MTNNETDINNVTKLYNRPFEEMSLLELYAEQGVHNWHRARMKDCIEKLKKRRWWLENNKPILSKEEIKRQYENGEISKAQYQTAFARRRRAIESWMHMEDRMKYAEIVLANEEAVVAYLEDLKLELQAYEVHKKNSRDGMRRLYGASNRTKHNPRKRRSKFNTNETLDPNRKWATREEYRQMPKLQKARLRWKNAKHGDAMYANVQKRMQPIVAWDVEKLRHIARDRGYFTDLAMVGQIAEHLNITIASANNLISAGRLSWSQCIIVGAVFEMTPKEFCDVFLSGYFREVGSGVYRAYVEDTSALLDRPYRARSKQEEGADDDVERTD